MPPDPARGTPKAWAAASKGLRPAGGAATTSRELEALAGVPPGFASTAADPEGSPGSGGVRMRVTSVTAAAAALHAASQPSIAPLRAMLMSASDAAGLTETAEVLLLRRRWRGAPAAHCFPVPLGTPAGTSTRARPCPGFSLSRECLALAWSGVEGAARASGLSWVRMTRAAAALSDLGPTMARVSGLPEVGSPCAAAFLATEGHPARVSGLTAGEYRRGAALIGSGLETTSFALGLRAPPAPDKELPPEMRVSVSAKPS